MKNEHANSTAPLLLGMAAGAALGAAGVMATNTSQRQMRPSPASWRRAPSTP